MNESTTEGAGLMKEVFIN